MNRERVVIDTNVFISGVLKPNGTPRKAINLAIDRFEILQSEETYLELTTRLSKAKFDKYVSELERTVFFNYVRNQSFFLTVEHQTNICTDADDNKFLELALSGKARYLITGDSDLLVLVNYYETVILNPADFMELVS
ncbi:MAG: putative toxin-antitoxin system toxin component, PIN family [Cyanobacteriota bacterium]|nr:putative toxin-antitoxin system toxin component, PIN family [Cyanobacteriota bacterium]